MAKMIYAALLRGINVGGNRRVPMAELRQVFETLGFTDVVTYVNSGNVIFSSAAEPDTMKIEAAIESHFGFKVDTLVLSAAQLGAIATTIPAEWLNDKEQKSDVLYLFSDINSPDIIDQIGCRPELETIIYAPGALITNVTRKNQSKSSLLKIVGTPLYRRMTIRNVITARKLAEMVNR